MKFAVETWSPEYGVSVENGGLDVSTAPVDPNIELPASSWAPIAAADSAAVARPARVLFIDGVRRVDARVWIDDGAGSSVPGLCATVAAGAVCVEPARAHLEAAIVARGVFSSAPSLVAIDTKWATYEPRFVADGSPEGLILGVQERMATLEKQIAGAAGAAELSIIDGPLRGREHVCGAVGYIKTQHVRYLPDALQAVVGTLEAGERTPLFCVGGAFTRLSWYVRLPGVRAHALSGIVRCELSGDRSVDDARRVAGAVTALLPRFASTSHKDTRAPQNLYPIAGLERQLRRRLGDPQFMERALRAAAAANGSSR
ncbi:MAG TPA: hypothetical protein VGQ20_15815 [Acidimicrobiales bacterium]|jgi:hypothetical protein|nr:hypothetical protein [Acidimicrobiales bacterium]